MQSPDPSESYSKCRLLHDKAIIDALESSELGARLLRPIMNIIISFMKSSSSWFEGIWISNASSDLGTIIISNSVGWFGIKSSKTLITPFVLHSIQYTKHDEYTINAEWKNLQKECTFGTVTIKATKKNTNTIRITLNQQTSAQQIQIIGTAKRLVSLRNELKSNDKDDEYEKEWMIPYEATKLLIECSTHESSKYLFDHSLHIPVFAYGTLGDRKCDANGSAWNASLIHGCYGKNAYIKQWKLYQHPSQQYPFADNKGDCAKHRLIGRLIQWNDVHINAFKIYQIDTICGYQRDHADTSFFKRKIVRCNVVNHANESEYETECWLWYVDSYSIKTLRTQFDCIQSGDWKDRKY